MLEELDRPHLMSVKMAVEAEKKYLEEEKYRIRLHDLVMGETGRLLSAMADKNFPTNIQVSKEALWGRLAAYEAMSETVIRCRAIFERRYARSGHIFSWTLEELLTSK